MSRSDQLPQPAGLEIVVGRTLAFCVHPLTAWPILSRSWRLLILTAYAAVGFVVVLSALVLDLA